MKYGAIFFEALRHPPSRVGKSFCVVENELHLFSVKYYFIVKGFASTVVKALGMSSTALWNGLHNRRSVKFPAAFMKSSVNGRLLSHWRAPSVHSRHCLANIVDLVCLVVVGWSHSVISCRRNHWNRNRSCELLFSSMSSQIRLKKVRIETERSNGLLILVYTSVLCI